VVWRVFSRVVKPHATIEVKGKGLYNFFEGVVDALRPILSEGVGSLVVAAPPRKGYAGDFLDHIAKHQPWMTGVATFVEIEGSATSPDEVSVLVRADEFKNALDEATHGEADSILRLLERRLNDERADAILYSLGAVEKVYFANGGPEPEHLILTDEFLAAHRRRGQRLLQASKSRGIKATIVEVETAAGRRLSQLGGMVLLTSPGR
jgi:stalled ribosome rescue protein Dom34